MMQDERISTPEIDISTRGKRLLARLEEVWQFSHELTFETLQRIIVELPEEEQALGIEAIAEHLVSTMKLHFLDIVAMFRQKAEEEDISVQERDEVVQDVMPEAYHSIQKLGQQLAVKSVSDLVVLGNITLGLYTVSQVTSAEQAERWMYTLPGIYRDRLEHEHLITCNKAA